MDLFQGFEKGFREMEKNYIWHTIFLKGCLKYEHCPGMMKAFWMVFDRTCDPYPTSRCRYDYVSAEGHVQQPLI